MGTPASPPPASVVPAQLGFLAIFNPSLGTTDDTIDDQIVYYASVDAHSAAPAAAPRKRNRSARHGRPTEALSPEERNERLRQIGLAQGMVEFSRGFAGGKTLDSIETDKSRVVLHELEPGWWILASIDLTKLPLPPRLGNSSQQDSTENVEYSSREVKPAALLMQDLLRAHSIFLLHHAASLSALFVRTRRPKFVAMLSRYWDIYLSTWNVMLHGNPACAVYGGIKIAASGELGVGVGEEERGSGEREVLEGFVGRIEGLIDLVVSKFGDAEPESTAEQIKESESEGPEAQQWLGLGEEPGAEDGAIFLGTGALSKNSLRDVVYWMEDLYTWGGAAYGVKESPTSTRNRTKRTRPRVNTVDKGPVPRSATATGPGDAKQEDSPAPQASTPTGSEGSDAKGMDKLVGYLKMGYGTHWSLGSNKKHSEPPSVDSSVAPSVAPSGPSANGSASKQSEPRPEVPRRASKPVDDTAGHYLIGLQGAVDDSGSDSPESDGSESESRTLVRTLTVELESEMLNKPENEMTHDLGSGENELRLTKSGHKNSRDKDSHFDSQDRNKTKRVRVVVYVSRPFIYTFLFEDRTDSLAYESLYRSLHYQLAPLRKPLAVSASYRPGKPEAGNSTPSHIFDLVWDSRALTIHSTIPCIPDHASMARYQNGEQKQAPFWSRVEAVNTHMQILNTYSASRLDNKELERTCKTSRGWWVVWTRIESKKGGSMTMNAIAEDHEPPRLTSEDSKDSTDTDQTQDSVDSVAVESEQQSRLNADEATARSISVQQHQKEQQGRREKHRKHGPQTSKEIVLIRRAGEHGTSRSRSSSLMSRDGDAAGWTEGASRLAQGIGIDTRKYIDELLSMGQ